MKRTSILRNVWDERLYDSMRARSRVATLDQKLRLGEYVREARRTGWTWSLAADAIRVSPTTAKRYATLAKPSA